MVSQNQRDHHVAGNPPSHFKTLDQLLEHRVQDKAERLQILDAVVEFRRFRKGIDARQRAAARRASRSRSAHSASSRAPAYPSGKPLSTPAAATALPDMPYNVSPPVRSTQPQPPTPSSITGDIDSATSSNASAAEPSAA